MRPTEKYAVIYRHRDEYPVTVMCKFFGVSRSGYYDFVKRLGQPEYDAELAKKIQECQNKVDKLLHILPLASHPFYGLQKIPQQPILHLQSINLILLLRYDVTR